MKLYSNNLQNITFKMADLFIIIQSTVTKLFQQQCSNSTAQSNKMCCRVANMTHDPPAIWDFWGRFVLRKFTENTGIKHVHFISFLHQLH